MSEASFDFGSFRGLDFLTIDQIDGDEDGDGDGDGQLRIEKL